MEVALALVLSSIAATAQQDPGTYHAIWVAESQGVLQVRTTDRSLLLEIPSDTPVRAVAVDPIRLQLWVATDSRLRSFGLDGEAIVDLELASPSPKDVFLILDPDGTTWMGVHRDLWAFSSAGLELQHLVLERPLEGLAFDPDDPSLWAATRKEVIAFDPVTGFEVERYDFGPRAEVRSISAAPDADGVWVATTGAVQRISSGGLATVASVDKAILVAGRRQGGAWVASSKEVLLLDGDGQIRPGTAPFAGRGVIQAMVADPVDGWLSAR